MYFKIYRKVYLRTQINSLSNTCFVLPTLFQTFLMQVKQNCKYISVNTGEFYSKKKKKKAIFRGLFMPYNICLYVLLNLFSGVLCRILLGSFIILGVIFSFLVAFVQLSVTVMFIRFSRGDPCCYINYSKPMNHVLCSGNKIICEKSHGRYKGNGICGSICR